MDTLFYFGTNLDTAGHYFWECNNDVLRSLSLYFPKGEGIPVTKYKEWPFNPEELPKSRNKGDVEFHQINGYSIIAICGSCKDDRPGTKSVFFIDGMLTKYEILNRIKATPIADKIIKAMKFEVMWTQLLNK